MAIEYYKKLSDLIFELDLESELEVPIVVKHFFSGAALYINGNICASWTPEGLALKLSENEASLLISTGEAKPLKYFSKGHVKKGYVLFDGEQLNKQEQLKKYFLRAAQITL